MRLLSLLLLLVVVVVQVEAVACAGDAAERSPAARAHYKRGRDHVTFGEYDAAIREFQAGYAIDPQPLFLFNIAECARAAGKDELAVDYYNRYLEARPEAPDRAEVRRLIVKLSRRKPGTEPGATTTPALPPPAAATGTATAAGPGPAVTTTPATTAATAAAPGAALTAPALTATATPAPPTDTAPRSRKGLWIGLGVGGAVLVAGAVVLAVVLTRDTRGGPPSGYADWGRFGIDGR